MSYIGLDLGTSGTKAVAFDASGQVMADSFMGYDYISAQPGQMELDPEAIWNAVLVVLANVAAACRGKEAIRAVSFSSFGEAFVAIDRQGSSLGNCILATDKRGSQQISQIGQRFTTEEIAGKTGLPPSSTYSLNKMLWLKENESDRYGKTFKLLLIQDFIIYRLCGEIVTDYSLASRTMAFDIRHKCWWPEILDYTGIDLDLLPAVRPAGSIIGQISSAAAAKTALPGDVILVLGGHDQPCAALGAGALKKGHVVDSLGTSECVTALLHESPLDPAAILKYKFPCQPFIVDGQYNTISYSHTAGVLLKWFMNVFDTDKNLCYESTGENIYQHYDSLCPELPGNLLVLPHFSGAATPYMNQAAKGAFIGLTLGTRKAEIYKAFLEGISFEMLINLECLEKSGISIDHLVVVGGGARSRTWLQIKADISGREIITLKCPEASAMGAAILAAVALGDYQDVNSAADAMTGVASRIYPDPARHDLYRARFAVYEKLYKSLEEINSLLQI